MCTKFFSSHRNTRNYHSSTAALLSANKNKAPTGKIMSNDTGQLFRGEKDRFQGVTIDSTKEPCDAEAFGEILKGTVQSDKQ